MSLLIQPGIGSDRSIVISHLGPPSSGRPWKMMLLPLIRTTSAHISLSHAMRLWEMTSFFGRNYPRHPMKWISFTRHWYEGWRRKMCLRVRLSETEDTGTKVGKPPYLSDGMSCHKWSHCPVSTELWHSESADDFSGPYLNLWVSILCTRLIIGNIAILASMDKYTEVHSCSLRIYSTTFCRGLGGINAIWHENVWAEMSGDSSRKNKGGNRFEHRRPVG